MFDFFKGNKVEINIELDRPSREYAPGDALQARITIRSEKDLNLRSGRFAILGEERYQYQRLTTSTDSDGNTSSQVNTEWDSKHSELYRLDFLAEGSLPAGTHTFAARCNLPADTRPSCEGKIISMRWTAKVTLDRKMAADFNQEAELRVLAPAPTGPSMLEEGRSNEPGEADLFLELPQHVLRSGKPLKGRLVIIPNKNFDVREVRLELVRWDYVPDMVHSGYENSSEKEVLVHQLAGKTQLLAGLQVALPFELPLPADLPPSVRLQVGALGYQLRGVLSRALRKDTHIVQDLVIYNGADA